MKEQTNFLCRQVDYLTAWFKRRTTKQWIILAILDVVLIVAIVLFFVFKST